MQYSKIMKRAWHLVRSYRSLWVFGVILAVTTVTWSSFWILGDRRDDERHGVRLVTHGIGDRQLHREDEAVVIYDPPDEYAIVLGNTDSDGRLQSTRHDVQPVVARAIFGIVIATAVLALLLLIVAPVARYVSEVAAIRMVDDHETAGKRYTVRRGFRAGWSMAALRLFLIDLIVIPGLLAFSVLIFLPAILPLLPVLDASTPAIVVGAFLALALVLAAVALIVIAWVGAALVVRLARRACVLEGLGVLESIRQGYRIARHHLKELAPVWLVTVGIEIAWPLLMLPVVAVSAAVGVLLGGAVALLAGGLATLAFDGATPWIVAGVVGIPVLILTLAIPLAFLGGLREAFLSGVWTLTFRELRAQESLEPRPLPRLDASSLESATAA